MMAQDVEQATTALAELFNEARCIVPFTGAGISTECGIPDFRSPGGLWTKHAPIPFDDFMASQEARDETWRRRFAMEATLSTAKPGRGHRALASLYHAGKSPGLVTQNIDNLHQVSGIPAEDIVELHGNTTFARCLDCNERFELQWVRRHMDAGNGCAPDCPGCGGYIKTATISFGQAMPDVAVRRAQDLAQSCDLLVSIGSSLVVWPAAGLPLLAKRSGAMLVIINREPTDFDEIADLVVREDIGTVLAPFTAAPSAA